jgi:predicted O-methyltransferase YrrM
MNQPLLKLDPRLDALLDRLHDRSDAQGRELGAHFSSRIADGSVSSFEWDERTDAFMRDKLVALDRDKAALCYRLCRALRARWIVEAGTSFGVSTLYLAAALRDNGVQAGEGAVIATELEPTKANAARANFAEGGIAPWIDLREGDLRETLKSIDRPVDFLLMDIWTPMARPALELVSPHLRTGAIVIADNTTQFREAYGDYFAFITDPANRLSTQTLPYPGGLELTVRI